MSFNIALTGLNAVTEQLNTISDNIANVGTTGFKSSRTEFGSLYSGTQAMGVGVLGKSQSMDVRGAMVLTGNNLDLSISGGSGLFVTRGGSGDITYTCAGAFSKNREGFLVDASGHFLQGYPVDAAGNLMVGTLGDLRLQSGNLPAKATDAVSFVANLDDSKPAIATEFDPRNSATYNDTQTTSVYDSKGKQHVLTQYFVKTGENAWAAHYYVDGTRAGGPQAITFDTQGRLQTPLGVVNINFQLQGAASMRIAMDYTRSTQSASGFVVSTNDPSGYAAGENTGVSIEKDGKVYATFSNGERLLQGQVALATFANANGLKSEDATRWSATGESGNPLIGVPGTGLFGDVKSGALEKSNVEMTQQLVGLMEGQRNYQASSKVLSTNKELTQVLFNAI